MPPIPQQLIAPVSAASYDGRLWGAWPNGDKPGGPPPAPNLSQPSDNELYVANGSTLTYQPVHVGTVVSGHWKKTYGPDCVNVNPRTGLITFPTAWMPQVNGANKPNQTVYIGAELSNPSGKSEVVMLVHIGKTSGQIKRVGPTRTHTSHQSLVSSGTVSSGDTIVVDSGTYTGTSQQVRPGNAYPAGTASAYTDIIARIPGQWIYDGQFAQDYAIYLQGNTATASWNNDGIGSTDRSFTQVQGIRTIRCNSSSLTTMHTHHIVFRYCWPGDAYYKVGTHNVPCTDAHKSTDILFEYVHCYGYGRYLISSYESDRVVARRCVGRITPYWGTEPCHSFVSFYRAQNCYAQNCWGIDSQIDTVYLPSWTSGTTYYTTDAFQVASTGAHGYGHSNVFDRCGAAKIATGMLHAASYELTAGLWCYTAREMYGQQIALRDGNGSQHGIMTGYRSRLYNSTFLDISFPAGTNSPGLIITSDAKQMYDVLINRADARIGGSSSNLAAAYEYWANTGGTLRAERVSLGDWNGPKTGSIVSGYPASLTEVSPSTVQATIANGQAYPGRVETGSVLDGTTLGARNTMKNKGTLGTFYGDADFESEVGSLTFPLPGEAITQSIYNGYTFYDAASGMPSFSGNYGVGASGENISYWLHTQIRPAAFPLAVDAQAYDDGGTKVRVSWLPHPSNKTSSYVGVKVYRNGTLLTTITDLNTCEYIDSAPIAVGTDIYTAAYMHASDGDSGASYPTVAKAA